MILPTILLLCVVSIRSNQQDVDDFDGNVINDVRKHKRGTSEDELMDTTERDQERDQDSTLAGQGNDEENAVQKTQDFTDTSDDYHNAIKEVDLGREIADQDFGGRSEREKKSALWGRRRSARRRRTRRRRRSSRRRGTGCHYVWYKAQCSDGCCWRVNRKIAECLNCGMKLYLPCGRYLFPPRRGPLMGTARTPTTDQSNWMTRMQSRKLHEVTLPGSHHTERFRSLVYETFPPLAT